MSRRRDVAIMEKTTLHLCASETEAQRYRSCIRAVSTSVIMHDYPIPPPDSVLSRAGSLSCISQQIPEICRRKTRPWWSCHCCQLITALGGRETDNEGLWYWCHYWSHGTMTCKINLNEIRWQQTCCGTAIHLTVPSAIPWCKISRLAHTQMDTCIRNTIDRIILECEMFHGRLDALQETQSKHELACRNALKCFSAGRLNIYTVMRNVK